MALVIVLILLSAGWLFWGWMVSEHRNIAWLRRWCSILFTIMAVLMGTGGGAGVTMVVLKRQHRSQVAEFASALEAQLKAGKSQVVLRELQTVIDPPDEWSNDSSDLLERMLVATDRLQPHQKNSSKDASPEDASRAETLNARVTQKPTDNTPRLY